MSRAVFPGWRVILFVPLTVMALAVSAGKTWAVASNNISLDSPVYGYLEKLASFGLLESDIKGIRPITKAEAARLLAEAERMRAEEKDGDRIYHGKDFEISIRHYPPVKDEPAGGAFVDEILQELRHLLEREISLQEKPDEAPFLDARPVSDFRVRYVYLNGAPRSYERKVHDPGGDGVFGIGAGLRPDTPTAIAYQHGTEGTPLLENNEGVTYGRKNNIDVRFSSEVFVGGYFSALVEPMFLYEQKGEVAQGRLNKGYAKLGGGLLELEVGRDANWLGLGDREGITLTNNAVNFDLVKLSSPEPLDARFLGALKYTLIVSRFDDNVFRGIERRPFFMAAKISVKPLSDVEIGLNLGRQVGGPGVDNSLGATVRGLLGGLDNDNSNSLAGLELRLRIPFLRNTEIYGEFSGEDAAAFWPIVDSYVGGVYIPRLTDDGKNDLRFEYFFGNNILYTNSTFPGGYIYRGMPIGNSQGGASQDFFFRLRHWFSVRHTAALEYFHTDRGKTGRLSGQFVEETNGWRGVWNFPLFGRADAGIMYGWERVNNFDLVGGVRQINQLGKIDLTYRY
jgi:hypothetical protein